MKDECNYHIGKYKILSMKEPNTLILIKHFTLSHTKKKKIGTGKILLLKWGNILIGVF